MKLYALTFLSALFIGLNDFRLQPAAHANYSCDKVPELNQRIIDFVDKQMNKKVGRGECWDLAAGALNATGATWDKNFGFGKEVDPLKDCVYPGDIMQFTNVTVEYTQGNRTFKETMAQHTAIIYKIKGTGDFVLADQNTTLHGKKVGLSPLTLKNVVDGKYQVFRPVK